MLSTENFALHIRFTFSPDPPLSVAAGNCSDVHSCQLPYKYSALKEVPTVAVLGSGGGLRAMISFLGSMSGFHEAGLLDCVTYLCGVSGSTWAISSLYENAEWSSDFAATISQICSNLEDANFDFDDIIDVLKREEHLLKRLEAAAYKEDYSATDLWGTVVSRVLGKEHNQKLSKQQEAVKNGHNPYPVYAAINKEYFDCDKKNKHPEIWFEFTPYECGFPSYGAFVETKLFGSKFEGSEMKEYHPEPSVYLLQEKKKIFAFIGNTSSQDPKHVGHNPFVSLVDAGLEINTAYPLMLRAERKVDVIISLDFSEGDLFETLIHATEYAKVNCLRFPPVNINKNLPTDCCVYSDPVTPTVIHMPLANSANVNEMNMSEFPTKKMKYNKAEIAKLYKEAKNNITRNKTKILEEIKKKMHSL
ncbi:PA24F phospholipase, partial [Polypterus senegalus]